MPIRSKRTTIATEDFNLYMELWQWKAVVMALDHYFTEVVEGNLPLDDDPGEWWNRNVIPDLVTKYSRNWVLLYEALSSARRAIDMNSIATHLIVVDDNLNWKVDHRDTEYDLEWEA